MSAGRRRRVLVINQYYGSIEATGQVLRQLCESLAKDWDVTVVAARPPDPASTNAGTALRGPSVKWVRATHFPRTSPLLRLANYLTFVAGALVASLRAGKTDLVYCMTDPPIIGVVGLMVARVRRTPFAFTAQDLHPDLGLVSGRLTNPVAVRLLRVVQRLLLTRADAIVAISVAMRSRLIERGAAPERVSVVPNWTDLDAIVPQPRDNAWARAHGLDARFVVMHSGNLGLLQSLHIVLACAAELPDVDFVLVGEGASKHLLQERAAKSALGNVLFLPHQPRDTLRLSLASADAHLVSLEPGLAGLIEPSKAYGVLAAARPMLAAVDAESDAGTIVAEHGCGVLVRPGDAGALADAIRRLRAATEAERAEMGRRGRALAEAAYSLDVAVKRYADLFATLVGEETGSTR